MRVDNNQKKTDKTNKDKPLVHNIFILDCSGSMFDLRKPDKYSAALQGINTELKALTGNKDVNFTHSLVEFGGRGSLYFTRWMKDDNSPLPSRSHLGNTALNDAILTTINKVLVDKKEEDKVLIKIHTDGEENNSETSFSQVKELIEQAKTKGVTVTFFGTEYDTDRAIHNYNLSRGNTMVHHNTVEEFSSLSNVSINSTMMYAKSVADGVDTVEDFYSKTVDKVDN